MRRPTSCRPLAGRLSFIRLILCALLLHAAGALAHGGDTDETGSVRAVLDELPPALSTLRIQLRKTLAPQLLVGNPTAQPLIVEDEDGRAFLRIGPDHVEGDLGAAYFHRTNTLMAPGAIPDSASGQPRWEAVAATPSWGWFDLRLRTQDTNVPQTVRGHDKRATVGQWSIPVQYGDSHTEITGHFEYVPAPGGIPEARITDAGALASTALVRAMNGSARSGLFIAYRGNSPLIVYGVADEPMLRFDADGVAVNRHSATWRDVAPAGAPPHVAGQGTAWTQISGQASYGWIDPRAGYTADVESAGTASVLKRWTIPVTTGGDASTISGVTEWQPVRSGKRSSAASAAGGSTATMHRVNADGEAEAVGTITFSDSKYGLLITPALHDVASQGPHGTHVHANPDCGAKTVDGKTMPGAGAGGHYDPKHTERHAGPYATGHLGDLPNLIVEADGTATIPVLAPRLEVADLAGRAVMMHARADRYAASGEHTHGKGGMRMYCGVIR